MRKEIKQIHVLGPAGSYLDGLAKAMDLGCTTRYGANFAEMIGAVEGSDDAAVLLPIKNTMHGPLSDVVGAFQQGTLMVETCAKLDVVSNIMGAGTLKDATCIGGKDVALQQITGYMPHLERRVMPSTSAAGQYIHETGDTTMLSVGSAAQADIYGLKILAKGVQDDHGLNRTTVLLVRGRNGWHFNPEQVDPKAALCGVMIMRIVDSDKPGTLHAAMGELAKRQINLTNLESLNIRGTELSEFFVTFCGTGKALADLAKSREAAKYMTLDILGTYPEPTIYDS